MISDDARGLQVAKALFEPLPRVLLVSGYQVAAGREAIFAAMNAGGFDPRQTVILEEQPAPSPVASADAGSVRVVRQSTDDLELEADLKQPAIMVITDCWTPSWRARALADSVQSSYRVLPANYTLRGIPLAAGHHHLVLEYAPAGYITGMWISAFAWFGWLAALWLARDRPL
jgi:hypothetical protein